MDDKLKAQLAKSLNILKDEHNKKDKLYEYGIDLINYEREYLTGFIDLISFLTGKDSQEEIEWWIYEDVEKIYYMPDGTQVNVKKAEDLLEYLASDAV